MVGLKVVGSRVGESQPSTVGIVEGIEVVGSEVVGSEVVGVEVVGVEVVGMGVGIAVGS